MNIQINSPTSTARSTPSDRDFEEIRSFVTPNADDLL